MSGTPVRRGAQGCGAAVPGKPNVRRGRGHNQHHGVLPDRCRGQPTL